MPINEPFPRRPARRAGDPKPFPCLIALFTTVPILMVKVALKKLLAKR